MQDDHQKPVGNLQRLLDRIEDAANNADPVTTGEVIDAVGRRSFGAMLLIPGLVTLAPIIGDIPGVPTLMGAIVLIIGSQLLVGRKRIWLPGWLLKRAAERDKVCKVIRWLRPVARLLDRISRPRLSRITGGFGQYIIALDCVLIAVAMPPMEFVPFSANGAGAALTLLGLGLIAHDGLLALIGLLVTAGTFAAVGYGLF
ncbi:exopolysaccharide biosynthesis protein [Thiohalobacter thiocyanaticus]|uniref:Exopolysaccharide biosynthesis protein n=1 Tax=Thiohalobacter thiocyanaticus TaxID=585455 RepID=A0A426QH58_9GAMM|nr:exopolysaccharide biosynthesis protein [Thiohalobacter thiocyanaticus]RRQ21073.1 exopolysaccharide biosynthesis protein [Thiohalobacter thiocyanaticus]